MFHSELQGIRRIIHSELFSSLVAQSPTLISLFKVNPACAAQSLVVPDLINGQEYLFRIRAENRFGFGPFTETIEGTKARDPIRTFPPFNDLFVLAAAAHRCILSQMTLYLSVCKEYSHIQYI